MRRKRWHRTGRVLFFTAIAPMLPPFILISALSVARIVLDILYDGPLGQLLLDILLLGICAIGLTVLWCASRSISDVDKIIDQMSTAVEAYESSDGPEDARILLAEAASAAEDMELLLEQYLHARDDDDTNGSLMWQARLTTLYGQITQHFLFNALDSLRGNAMVAEAPEIAEIAEIMSRFFRYSINQADDMAEIPREVENAVNYLRIQRYRFGDRVRFCVEMDREEMDRYLIPKLILLPIVENSVIHDLLRSPEGGCVTIQATAAQDHISITVINDSAGIPPQRLEELRAQIVSQDDVPFNDKTKESYYETALRNVYQRMRFLFGDDCGLYLNSTPSQKTDVTVVIPAIGA